jgi:hypothetical protein
VASLFTGILAMLTPETDEANTFLEDKFNTQGIVVMYSQNV